MGRVYLARSAGGRTVAVKVVHAELAAQDQFRRRFAREIAVMEQVGGVGTAPVLDADSGAEAPWVAIGYVAGPALRTVVAEEHGPLPPASVRSLAVGLAQALAHIHAAGLVHRDLKPSNILLTVDGPRIIDFGIARAIDTVVDGGLTSTGAVVGSPGFMSPEQVRGERLTAASDIFCLGSVLAYAATGRSPFGSADSGLHATMFRIAYDEPDLSELPAELDDLVRACLAKDPATRPTAAELAALVPATDPWLPAGLLAQLGRHAAGLLDADGDTSHIPPVTRPRSRTRPQALVAVSTTAALAAAAALTVMYWPGRNGSERTASERSGNVVPATFIGAWEGVLKGTQEAPFETARLEIAQGKPGDKAAVYVQVLGERMCMGRSTLISANDNRIVFGESDVTTSVPAKQCTPAAHQTLTVRSPEVLQWTSGAASATFRKVKAGPDLLPAKFVGHWKQPPLPEVPADEQDLYSSEVTITQGPIGAPLVRFENTFPKTDAETGASTGDTIHCAYTALLGGADNLVIVGPSTPDTSASDADCVMDSGSSQSLRIDRFDGKDRLLVYGMSGGGEPSEYHKN